MDYIKLANLLYPNVDKTPDYWENKYPKRDLPDGAEVTRIAPSPTGFLHIGTAYGAQIDREIAKNTNGVFYFRLEDTDKKRELKNSGTIAYEGLCEFGIIPDEGYCGDGKEEKGIYGPYVQSKRLDIYNTYAKHLVSLGRAYPCFCQKAEDIAEIKERRNEQLIQNSSIEDKDVCRNLTYEEIEEKIKNGVPFALRFLSKGNSENIIKIQDAIKGEREIRENQKDFILIKSNGIPPYAFAHAVDDHLMRTTTVVRGEEWYPSTAAHIELFDAFGFERVKYAHTPVVCKLDENGNKRKLSKRKDEEADARYFFAKGYPVEAIKEYLMNLANSNFEEWRLENPLLPLSEFTFSQQKIGSNNPIFDMNKINDMSKNHIATYTAEQIYDSALAWAKEYDEKLYAYLSENKEVAVRTFSIDRGTPKARKDIAKWSDIPQIYSYFFTPYFTPETKEDYELEGVNLEKLKTVLEAYKSVFKKYDDKQQWFDDIKQMAGNLGYATDNKAYKQNPEAFQGNTADVCAFVRLAISARKNSLDLFEIISIIGEEEVKNRLNKLINLI